MVKSTIISIRPMRTPYLQCDSVIIHALIDFKDYSSSVISDRGEITPRCQLGLQDRIEHPNLARCDIAPSDHIDWVIEVSSGSTAKIFNDRWRKEGIVAMSDRSV